MFGKKNIGNEKEMKGKENQSEWLKVKSVSNGFTLDMVQGILDDNHIPYMLKDMGSGGYMRIATGNSMFGTDILVERSDYEKAMELLQAAELDEGELEEFVEEEIRKQEMEKSSEDREQE